MESRSSKAVKNFFDVLLDEPSDKVDIESQPLEKLLEKVGDVAPKIDVSVDLIAPSLLEKATVGDASSVRSRQVIDTKEKNIDALIEKKQVADVATELANQASQPQGNPLEKALEEGFPALFFEAMGQVFSVPLVKLKGIYRKKSLSKLIGKPPWFSGVQIERDEKLNVIDTALYLMPEKLGPLVEYSPNYQYIIVIGDSNWGLECNRLIDSTTLSHDEIKWRTDVKRNPWLAGTVRHRMCSLLDVDALIELFENNETK